MKRKKKAKRSLLTELRRANARARTVQTYRARLREEAEQDFPLEPMTSAEFREAIEQLGLTQERAGVWLGLSPRQGQRYGNGEVEIPGPVGKLLRLVLREGLRPEEV